VSETPERRHAKRISIRLPVVYRGPDGVVKQGTTENVSGRGMLLVAKALPTGTRLHVAVTGPDGTERELVGEVVRSTPEGHIGVAITGDEAAELMAIVEAQPERPPPAD
jgi:PilZ domain